MTDDAGDYEFGEGEQFLCSILVKADDLLDLVAADLLDLTHVMEEKWLMHFLSYHTKVGQVCHTLELEQSQPR